MPDIEPSSQIDINFHPQDSKEVIKPTIPQALVELRNQREQKDFLWIKHKQEISIEQIRDSIPQEDPPVEIISSDDRSLYSIVYNMPSAIATISDWKLGGGLSLEQSSILKSTDSNGQIIEYEPNKNIPKDWNKAREIVLNDIFFRRHQEFGDALAKINPIKPDEYRLDIYLNPDKAEDKTIISRYQGYEFGFQETEFGYQPILDLSNPPGNEFLFTPTAVELFSVFENAGLELNHELSAELVLRNEQRYGNSYVTLGREIAKLVSDTHRNISKLFLVGEDSGEIWEKIDSLEIPDDPAAALLIKIIKQLHRPTPSLSDLPVSKEIIEFKAGTCKDLETYFSQSANQYSTRTKEINGKRFLKEGSHHSDVNHMMINLEPIVFNGVILPPGNLFRDDYNGGFHYMRPTAFCFDQQYSDQVFGEEYRLSIDSWGPSGRIFNFFHKAEFPQQ